MADHIEVNKEMPNGAPFLELYLGRTVFATGRRLSGVVVFRLDKPTNIRSLIISISGSEYPTGMSLTRAFHKNSAFFEREVLLSGSSQPRLTSDRLSLLWNAVLGRDKGRTLSAGEHTYPFSILLPASLPPSYSGKAGQIEYRVTARVQFAAGRTMRVSSTVPVVFVPRVNRSRPVALSYPTADGTIRSTELNISLQLPRRVIAMGDCVEGKFTISNPNNIDVPRVTVALEVCEWVRLAVEREIHRDRVDISAVKLEDSKASSIEAAFKLRVPRGASPTIEGTAISIIWLLKLTIDVDPPLEFKTPITVYAPLTES